MKRLNVLERFAFALMLSMIAPLVWSHGDVVAREGGIAVAAGEMTIEFVIAAQKVTVYLNDHGVAVSTAGATGTLVVGTPAEERAVPMRADGGDAFVANGVTPQRGDRIKFFAKMPDGQVHVAQIAIP